MRMATNRIKEMMNDVYARHGIKKKGVVTNLLKEYGIAIKPCKITICRNERVGGYEFI